MKSILLITFIIFPHTSAYAYLEPGTASIIIQFIIAGLGAIIVYFKNLRDKIKKIFKKITSKFF